MLRRLLLRLDRTRHAVESKGMRVLRSFIGNVTVSVSGSEWTPGVNPKLGYAESGDLRPESSRPP